MTLRLRVMQSGVGNTIQDRGRFGHRHAGMAVCGQLDPWTALCANALISPEPVVGKEFSSLTRNFCDWACIEIRSLGPSLMAVGGDVRLALAGSLNQPMRITDGFGQERKVAAWQSFTLHERNTLVIGGVAGTAYLAVQGGFDVPFVLGSRSTYLKAAIGGLNGQTLQAWSELPCGSSTDAGAAVNPNQHFLASVWSLADAQVGSADKQSLRVRVMAGPQAEHFEAESLQRFYSQSFEVTDERDRMGLRLAGSPLKHLTPSHADILSEGVVPGSIQVPANGQAVVLMADAQTVGGYPKIATVISADLPLLAQAKTGQKLSFALVTASQAREALAQRIEAWMSWYASIRRVADWGEDGLIDEANLYSSNLISGVTDGQ